MANLYKARMENNVIPTVLPPVNDSVFQDFTLEPQMIRARTMNTADLYLNSSDGDIFRTESSPTDLIIGQGGARGSILMRKVKRIGLTKVAISHTTPNVNARNNQFLVFRKDTLVVVEVILAEAFINCPLDLINYIVTSLNASAGLAGMNFVSVPAVNGPNNVFGLKADIEFLILNESTCIQYGLNMYGVYPGSKPAANSNVALFMLENAKLQTTIGPMHLQYSAFVDFTSTTLNSYTKLASASTSNGANRLLYRLYLDRWTHYESNPGVTGYYAPNIRRDLLIDVIHPTYFTWNPDENISTIDIQVLDEYGLPFYTPSSFPTADPTNPIIFTDVPGKKYTGLQWQLNFNCEI